MEWNKKLAEYQATPPPPAWNEIENTLRQDKSSLYHHTAVPPNESWEAISTKLSSIENSQPSPAFNWLRPVLRYAAMVAFCNARNITYTTDSSGILYQIITAGASKKPNLCETISMTYTGTLLNGTQFDAGTISYPLSQLILGWQIAVPKIGKGGRIKVVIPSSLAYGGQARSGIPANSPLYFDIVLN